MKIAKEIFHYLKIASIYIVIFLIFFGILWWISIMAMADYAQYTSMTVSVEKSDYYMCIDRCEEEYLNN